MADEVGFPHYSVALFDAQGKMTRAGLRFLQELWLRTGGDDVDLTGYVTNASLAATLEDYPTEVEQDAAIDAALDSLTEPVRLACSDLTTALTTGTSVGYFRVIGASNITSIRASLLTASTSGAVTVDINKNGASILSTKLTIDQDEKTSVTAATPYVLTSAAVADDDEITIDIDGAGSGAKGLIVSMVFQ